MTLTNVLLALILAAQTYPPTLNVNRSGRAWDVVGMTSIRIPPSERQP